MKKIALILMMAVAFVSCNDDDGNAPIQNVTVDFNFTHNWDGDAIENADFDVIQYTNAHGETLSLSKLVTFTPQIEIPEGTYSVSFTFGFDDEDNDQNYQDLNSADGGWNVPVILGGGYHYMRMEGKYIDASSPDETNYQYHTIRAVDLDDQGIISTLTDTSFEVNLGQVTIGNTTNIEVKMNVAEWFKNPNTWDLTQLYTMLMPNYNAQIMMSGNGANGVFSLGNVTQ